MAGARVIGIPVPQPRREERPRTRHLRVIGPDRPRLGLTLSPRAGVILTILAFVGLFGVAASHALLIQNQAHIDELDDRVAAEQARYEELRLEVAQLESPQRIMEEATTNLGMVPPAETVWLTPDEPAPAGTVPEEPPESTDTSAARVKPYLEATP
jgi:cell division protein FtsL